MALSREEIAAELAWRYLEHVREADAEPLSGAELDQLVDVMKSVAPTGEALTEAEVEERRSAVRRRVERLQGAAGPAPVPAARHAVPRLPVMVPAWRFRVACGLAAALAVLLGTVSLWHHPPVQTVVRRQVIPRDIRGVEAMDEQRAHELIPRMLANRLSPKEEKDLMAHMLVCPGCFRDYVQMRHPSASAMASLYR